MADPARDCRTCAHGLLSPREYPCIRCDATYFLYEPEEADDADLAGEISPWFLSLTFLATAAIAAGIIAYMKWS